MSVTKTTADKVDYSMVFVPNEDNNGITYNESVEWLEQYYSCRAQMDLTGRRILLIVGGEAPREVWSMKNNNHKGVCYLEWRE